MQSREKTKQKDSKNEELFELIDKLSNKSEKRTSLSKEEVKTLLEKLQESGNLQDSSLDVTLEDNKAADNRKDSRASSLVHKEVKEHDAQHVKTNNNNNNNMLKQTLVHVHKTAK